MTQAPGKRTARPGAVLGLTAALSLSVAACGGNLSGGAAGGEFPSGPITIAVGQDPGGSTDLIARALAEGLTDDLGVAAPVVNTPGANGALAANEVAGQEPDGQNLLVINASLTAITPLAVSEDEAVAIDDFEVVAGISRDDYVLVSSPASGLETLADLEDAGDDLKFGTTGVGTGSQLAQELLFNQAGISGTAVPFNSGAPTLTAVLGDQVDVAAIQLGEAIGQIEAGELNALLTFSAERNEFLEDTPTAVEEGYEVEVAQYRALVAPSGTPDDVLERLREASEAAFATEQYRAFNEDNLLTAHEIPGDQVVEEWTASLESYRSMTEEYGIDLGGSQ
ncbi:Bug family tripartite tricarboxylate transporter substrate binding protein [Nocardiopsis sp. CA-288880]|jgi:tripartite-type tricarboxylate transporter receptor subunit TctC|uniref:Bug family tripartite tricarboxylate transporter substrate binding protein n=1 Tax=Nocardiopsis sp. CA-288880 TaxID=3239995 RepID=UPI003D971987